MRKAFVGMLSFLAIMNIFSRSINSDRQPVAAGRFYPADRVSLTKDITTLFNSCRKTAEKWNVRAVISPHAGYVYSGKIAAEAFHAIPSNTVYRNIFIIGSSHVSYFEGASVYSEGDYITPLGKAIVNREIAAKLKDEYKVFSFSSDAHIQEHSIEVQVPFIQTYFSNTPRIVPIIIGTNNESTVRKIAEALKPWFTPENLFVISSDFSHYPSYDDANRTDSITAQSIVSGDPRNFLATLRKNSAADIPGLATSMCGWTSGLTLLFLTEGNKDLEIKHLDYANSGDSPAGRKNEVVGYHAFAVLDKSQKTSRSEVTTGDIVFSKAEKDQLFRIADRSISTMLYERKRIVLDEKDMSENLRRCLGAFVTIKIDGQLRGCIGRFISEDPLYKVVRESAISSAFEDPRFNPLTKEEYEKIETEITVLGPMKKISDISEIVLGKHGIYIKKDFRSGTMLPQVATENHWNVEEFLGYTARDKAGIGWTGWKEADIYIYEGIVLKR